MAATQVGSDQELIRYPAGCFSWEWESTYGDRGLHESSASLKALHDWIGDSPHLDVATRLVNRASLLGICLGLGILLGDACKVLFTKDGGFSDDTPAYITDSIWTVPGYDILTEYTKLLQRDLQDDAVAKRYVD